MARRDVVQRWLALPHATLVEEIHRLVKRGDDEARRHWVEVREHQVLAGRVRGILSALHREKADHRDAAMWQLWIAKARDTLKPPSAPARAAAPAPDPPPAVEPGPERAGPGDHGVVAPPPVVFRPAGE